ncbi:TIGR01777 family oxidoreductase [Rubritalea profundi]|uniref:TIGR01777 family protein n=1 Tax=Rubritalea profundi TaxID=1658618 RepID=A0A2S7U683_9BACT|nr:TIGR01777 family oxidoreductase [Rubritalea profundi]PQJ29822.1 TIGR01777 family protein [Rubritalea profundi]
MKTIVIAGANGFLGRVISRYFLQKKWNVIGIARNQRGVVEGVDYVEWDGKTLGVWTEALEWVDVLVNLAGRSVNCRYGEENRQAVLDSRVKTTQLLGEAVAECENPPKVWINSSTATIYRHAEDRPQGDFDGEIGAGFSVNVAKAWEKAFFEDDLNSVRKIAIRSAVVMADEPETVWTVLQRLARLGLGGKMGSGKQRVSWISDLDFARAVEWLAENDAATGTYNVSAPNPVTNANLMRCVRDSVGMRIGLPATVWMLEIGTFFMRTETELVLKSRWVIPTRLLAEGFQFEDPDLIEWSDK